MSTRPTRRERNLERNVVGCELFVRVVGGYIAIGPVLTPDSALRFHRGRAPRVEGVPLVSKRRPK